MSEITRAAIGMPFEMAMENELSRRQFHSIAQALLTERDKLRAEVAGLRTGYEAYEQVNAGLKAEIEALRRGRYTQTPFAPFQESALGYTGCFICGGYTDHGGLRCPKMSPAAKALSSENQRLTPVEPLRVPHPLDAAMGNGEQS